MDPFVKITCSGGQTFETKVHENAGKEPVWEETFEIDVANINSDSFNLNCFESNAVLADGEIGCAMVKISDLSPNGDPKELEVEIFRDEGKESAGIVILVSHPMDFAKM